MSKGPSRVVAILCGLLGFLVLLSVDQLSRTSRYSNAMDPRDIAEALNNRPHAPTPSDDKAIAPPTMGFHPENHQIDAGFPSVKPMQNVAEGGIEALHETNTPSHVIAASHNRVSEMMFSEDLPTKINYEAQQQQLGVDSAFGPSDVRLANQLVENTSGIGAAAAYSTTRTVHANQSLEHVSNCGARPRSPGTKDLECLFSADQRQRRDGSRPHFYISDLLIDDLGGALLRGEPPYDKEPQGKHFKARYTGDQREYEILGHEKMEVEAAKQCLNHKWLHIAGDSTGRQLFNSLVIAVDARHTHHLVTKYDDCVAPYHQRRMALLKTKPRNKTAIIENHMWLCSCRQHLVFWEQHFHAHRDGFDFNITYSYKEWMYEPADLALLQGKWPKKRRTGETVGNLFEGFAHRKPDILIANSGAHAFHLPEMELDMPEHDAVHEYARNTTKYVDLIQTQYLRPNQGTCFLWKANNVPPTHKCPVHHYALNYVTVPAMLKAGLHVIDPEELSSKNHAPAGKVCDIHTAPQDKIAQLTLSAICQACGGG